MRNPGAREPETKTGGLPPHHESTLTIIQDLAYDSLGIRTTLTSPQCTATACTGTNDLPAVAHVATTSYNQGMATEVSSSRGPTGSCSYHPNFRLSKLAYSNGVNGSFLEGTKGMSRATRLTYKKGSTPLFDTGTYSYDGTDNIYALGADLCSYDQANRLGYGSVAQAGSSWESYSYDHFDRVAIKPARAGEKLENTARAEEKLIDAARTGKGVFQTTVEVAGRNVTVRGAVVEGSVRLGTAFIP